MKTVFFLSLGLYAAATLIQLAGAFGKWEKVKKTAWAVFLLGFLAHLVYFVWRGLVAQRLPLASQFEFACGFALCIPVVLLVARTRVNADWIATAGMAATALLMGYAATQRMEITELMPALRSFWFNFHIGAAALSYSAFLVAGVVALRYVLQHRKGESADSLRMKQLEQLGPHHLDHLHGLSPSAPAPAEERSVAQLVRDPGNPGLPVHLCRGQQADPRPPLLRLINSIETPPSLQRRGSFESV